MQEFNVVLQIYTGGIFLLFFFQWIVDPQGGSIAAESNPGLFAVCFKAGMLIALLQNQHVIRVSCDRAEIKSRNCQVKVSLQSC